MVITRDLGSSPLTRGAPGEVAEGSSEGGLIPAHAGSTFAVGYGGPAPKAHPRSRGEHGPLCQGEYAPLGSSPLTRGARMPRPTCCRVRGLIPAHAGSTTSTFTPLVSSTAHPRSRGEHITATRTAWPSWGSSPLTRGALWLQTIDAQWSGLIPAHAGSTTTFRLSRTACGAHPRSRGEHLSAPPAAGFPAGSSPLTRGARLRWGELAGLQGLIPAHAGSTVVIPRKALHQTAHPRSRGEHIVQNQPGGHYFGSSPLTRGAPGQRAVAARRGGLIPAHAGSTGLILALSSGNTAHPRLRGEHRMRNPHRFGCTGSSPLTRGARCKWSWSLSFRGLIPAYAGST